MTKNDSFKKKELDKNDYKGKDTAAKVVKGTAIATAIATFGPKLIKEVIKLGKKWIFKA